MIVWEAGRRKDLSWSSVPSWRPRLLALAEVITQGEVGKHGGKRLTETEFSSNSKT